MALIKITIYLMQIVPTLIADTLKKGNPALLPFIGSFFR
jgi:hypothetical protein